MKKIKTKLLAISLVASIFTTNVPALTIEESGQIALKENLNIQSKNYDYLESIENISSTNSTLLPKVDLSYSYNDRDEVNSGQVDTDATLSEKISYNLFNGFKDIADKNSAKFLSKSSNFSLNALKQDIILDTKIAYINYLDKQNALDTYISAYKLFQEQYEDSKNRYNQGLIAKNDLLQVQVNMSSAKQNVVKAKGDVRIAKYNLSNILGGKDLSNEAIEKLDEKKLVIKKYDEKALENRSEIQALKMNIEAIKEQTKSSRSAYYPKINASLSHNKYYEDINTNEDQNIASLSASWNLFNGGFDKSKTTIYKTRLLKAKAQLVKTNLDIKLQFENANSDLEVAIDNLQTAVLSLELALENYDIVKNRFSEGVSTSTDLSDANFLLTQARQNHNRAYFDKFLALSTLDRVIEK
ncbi:TolC family protein [Poseidonibacter sp.]|uniref:TolC family protein n=1 Tax=Poseidonibacter sp. TaxID=2321188 RepID=UPI003C73DA65